MKRLSFFAFLLMFILVPHVMAESLVVDKFSIEDAGRLPNGWKSRNNKMTKEAMHIYKVVIEGDNAFLFAHSRGDAIQIGKKVRVNLKKFPILTWRWKVDKLCEGGDERYKKTGDSVAAIYVVFPTWKKWNPKVIKYVWSASDLPTGFKTKSPYASNTKIIILENKSSPMHRWVQERANVLNDYKYFFGKKVKNVKLIGIMTDSDNTKTEAIASYDDIMFESPTR